MSNILHAIRILVVFLGAFLLSGCASDKAPPSEKPAAPCTVDLIDYPSNAMGKLGIRPIRVGDRMRIIIPADSVFYPQSADIRREAYPGLQALAGYLKKFSLPPANPIIKVRGYTDDIDSVAHNQWLAEAQARSIIAFLWTHGLSHCQMAPIGIGEDEAYTVASNRSVEGSTANRRVELSFWAEPSMLQEFKI